MPDPAALALIPVAGVIAAALIAGLFLLAGKRADAQAAHATATDEARRYVVAAADEARRELVEDLRERVKMLTDDRDEARRQVTALEAIVLELRGPTRGIKP